MKRGQGLVEYLILAVILFGGFAFAVSFVCKQINKQTVTEQKYTLLEKDFVYGDKVEVTEGFYKGQTAFIIGKLDISRSYDLYECEDVHGLWSKYITEDRLKKVKE